MNLLECMEDNTKKDIKLVAIDNHHDNNYASIKYIRAFEHEELSKLYELLSRRVNKSKTLTRVHIKHSDFPEYVAMQLELFNSITVEGITYKRKDNEAELYYLYIKENTSLLNFNISSFIEKNNILVIIPLDNITIRYETIENVSLKPTDCYICLDTLDLKINMMNSEQNILLISYSCISYKEENLQQQLL